MIDFLSKKQKIGLGILGLASLSLLLGKVYLDTNNYKMLKKINKKICKNTWDYYE